MNAYIYSICRFWVLVLICFSGWRCSRQSDHLILIDGSSTVYPISEAVSEEFLKLHPEASIAIGESGTGGGFEKFCRGETDINNASRPITSEEVEACRSNGIEFIELPIAYDGIAVVVHPSNTWVDYLTVDELRTIWEPASQRRITRWSQVRPGFPDREIHLFGAGVASGTYDYFTEAITGTRRASRGDYTASEDDNVLVQGIATDPLALGYFGLAYYTENRDRLKAVPIANQASRLVLPTYANVRNGSYQPLTRPEFIYVRLNSAKRKVVQDFIAFYLSQGPQLVKEVGYVPLSEPIYQAVYNRFLSKKTGSLFSGKDLTGVRLEEVLATNANENQALQKP